MSGHSKWSTIKRKKGALDAKRGKLFTKLARAITVAARQGGTDPTTNATLRAAVSKAQEARMPKTSIQRAVKKAESGGVVGGPRPPRKQGVAGGESLETVTLEGYGPAGVAVLVQGLTDNRNRMVGEVRGVFTQFGGTLGERGSTAYIFGDDPTHPQFVVPVSDEGESKRLHNLIESLNDLDDVQEVYTNVNRADTQA